MKLALSTLLTFLFSFFANAQSAIELGKFPTIVKGKKPLLTSKLLKAVKLESLRKRVGTYYAESFKDSLLTTYHYRPEPSFEIVSFNGMVLEYTESMANEKILNTSYFDKRVWVMFANAMLPNLPDSLQLSLNESREVLQAYYSLLGASMRDEYGWICEYGTAGWWPPFRQHIFTLMRNDRLDLIKPLLQYPNVQTQLYAADALIYNDYENHNFIKLGQQNLIKIMGELDSLRKLDTIEDWKIPHMENRIERQKETIEYLKSQILSKSDWDKIYDLRDSKKIVITCGNMGSNKIYEVPISELLSDKAIAEIPNEYKYLEENEYLDLKEGKYLR